MNRHPGSRIPESQLTGGLGALYHHSVIGIFLLLLIGLLHPLFGWEPARVVMLAGVILLFAVPIVSVLWVGLKALRSRDRQLLLVVLGIVLLMAAARLAPLFFQG